MVKKEVTFLKISFKLRDIEQKEKLFTHIAKKYGHDKKLDEIMQEYIDEFID